ncbi:hypothetical protein H6P81_003378 [Aristolochia fimbriata]|uniref:Uncharacterized protein n=1 Tax=Aristolochia fimbriata TaxID=158543 RepID=A0AAV7FCE2_ARIFI|nr:hypothetical protein H6P81_003378 [Aristolochia fimbriata]
MAMEALQCSYMQKSPASSCWANALKNSAPLLEVLEIAGNDISAEAAPALAEWIEEVKEILKASEKGLDVLGPLGENDPEEDVN